MAKRALTVAMGTPFITSHEAEGMAEVIEVKVRHAGRLTGPVKRVPYIVVAPS
jgi:hypothetical protein